MKGVAILGIVVIACGLAACSGGGNSPTPTPTPSHVYIAGQVGTAYNEGQVPVYWKDGVLNILPYTGGGVANCIAVDKSGNVYVEGGQNGEMGYWKNSTFTPVSLGSYIKGYVQSCTVDTNGNVWLVGKVGTSSESPPDTFVYWKNSGNPTTLPGSPADVQAVQADTAGNTYVAGVTGSGGTQVPVFWKNMAGPNALPPAGDYGNTTGLAVDGSGNISIVGLHWGSSTPWWGPAYWKTAAGTFQNPVALGVGTYNNNGWWWVVGAAVDSSGNLGVTAAYDPSSEASYPSKLLFWKTATSAPVEMTLPSGTTTFNWPCPKIAFDAKGHLFAGGQVGSDWGEAGAGNGPLIDGKPVCWEDGVPTLLDMGTGNSWGQASGVAVGP